MALTWGSWAGDMQIGLNVTRTPSTITKDTSSVTYRTRMYIGYRNGHNFNGTLSYSGYYGNGSQTYRLDHPWGGAAASRLIVDRSASYSIHYDKTVSSNVRAETTVVWNGSKPSHQVNFTIPRRPYHSPRAPKSASASRNSDTQATVTWTRDADANTGARPWSGVYIERQSASNTSWTRIATVTGTGTSYTDKGISANNRFRYRVISYNSAGSSGAIYSGYIITTPSSPNNLVATKDASGNIVVKWSNRANYQTGVKIYDNGSLVATLTTAATQWTHGSPNPSITHTYTARAVSGSLDSALSSASNTVQLMAPPLAPTGFKAINTTVAQEDGDPIRFEWNHNPVDSSEQVSRQLSYKIPGSGTWTMGIISPSADEWRIVATPGGDSPTLGTWTWRVRTWGMDPNPSPWSSEITTVVENRPQIAVLNPESASIIETNAVTASWNYSQAQGRAQRGRLLRLIDTTNGAVEVWRDNRNTPSTSWAIPFTLQDDSQYQLAITVTGTNGLASQEQLITFGVDYLEPDPAEVNIDWDTESGYNNVGIHNPDTNPEVVSNRVFRNVDPDSPWSIVKPDATPQEPVFNIFTNPNLVGSGSYAKVAENLYSNPRLKGSGIWSQVWRNYFTSDPGRRTGNVVGLAHWNGSGTSSMGNASVPWSKSGRATWTTLTGRTGLSGNVGPIPSLLNGAQSDGDGTVTFELTINLSHSVNMTAPSFVGDIEILDSVGAMSIPAQTPTRLWITVRKPSGPFTPADQIRFNHRLPEGNAWFDVADLDAYPGPFQPGRGWFDGSTTTESAGDIVQPEDFRWRWLGEENASESVMEGELASGFSNNGNVLALVAPSLGSGIGRLIRTGPSVSSYVTSQGGHSGHPTWTGLVSVMRTEEEASVATSMATLERSTGSYEGGTFIHGLDLDRVEPGEWVHGRLTRTMATNSARIHLSPPSQIGKSFFFKGIGLYVGNYPYEAFNGDSAPAETGIDQPEDFRIRWTGGVDSSSSVMEIDQVRGITGVNTIAGVSTWGGKPAVRLIANSDSQVASFAWTIITVPGRAGGTVMGTSHIKEPISPVVSQNRIKIQAEIPYQTFRGDVPNAPGSYPQRLAYNTLTSSYRLNLHHGGRLGSPDVWWTDIGIFEGDYMGPWFGGDVLQQDPESGLMIEDTWVGDPNGSYTQRLIRYPEFIDSEWELVGEAEANGSITDYEGLTYGITAYAVDSITSIGSSSRSYKTIEVYDDRVWLSHYDTRRTAALFYNIQREFGSEKVNSELFDFDGRTDPVLIEGEAINSTLTVTGKIDPYGMRGTSWRAFERVAEQAGTFVYRDKDGRRWYARLTGVSEQIDSSKRRNVTFTVTRLEKPDNEPIQ